MSEPERHEPERPAPMAEERASSPGEERIDAFLSVVQFVVTMALLLGAAAVAYMAGSRSVGKEGKPAAEAVMPAAGVDVATIMKPTPELIAKGKSLFAVNCASCHGIGGAGDGPAAAALNPKPRNFIAPTWRYGGGVSRIVQTITVGSPGTAMAAFTAIPLEDRFALAHFIRSLGPTPEEDKPADLAWLGPVSGARGAGPGAGGPAAAKPGPTLPLEMALRLLAEPAPPTGAAGVAAPPADGPGAMLYTERCASCHGVAGEGGVRVRMLGSSPYVYVTTASFAASRTGWASDPVRFESLVTDGVAGYVMPGNGDLSRDALRDLFQYTSRLREQLGGTPASAGSASPRS